MPKTTAPTTTYSFESVYIASSIDYTIDKSSYTNLLTATKGTIVTASVTPESLVAYSTGKYTFSFVTPHEIPINSVLIVTFPSDVVMNNPSATANTCDFVCTATSTKITVTGLFTTAVKAAGSTVAFSASQIQNPVSLQPSSTFAFETQTSGGYTIDTITSGITVTMTSVNNLVSVEIAPESLINAATTNLELKIVASSPLKNGDVLIVTFPSQVKAPSGTIA